MMKCLSEKREEKHKRHVFKEEDKRHCNLINSYGQTHSSYFSCSLFFSSYMHYFMPVAGWEVILLFFLPLYIIYMDKVACPSVSCRF